MAYYKEIINRINRLRERMMRHEIDYCLVSSSDDHASEYTSDYYKVIDYLTGFNGSNGTLLISKDSAWLWTDGRYFTQAAAQTAGTGIIIMRQGEEGIKNVDDFVANSIVDGQKIGFDGTTFSSKFISGLLEKCPDDISVEYDFDPARHVWLDRPARSRESLWLIPDEITGKSCAEKIELVRALMINKKVQYHVISSLDDICWLLNIRGGDIAYTPVCLSFCIISANEVRLYIQIEAVDSSIRSYLSENGVVLCSYDRIYQDLSRLIEFDVYLDASKASYAITKALANSNIISGNNLTSDAKACKNKNEREGMRIAHIDDSIAFCEFIYWLKNSVGKEKITEISAAKKLNEFRCESPSYLDDSFETIMAYGEHSAIIHYEPSETSNVSIEPEGLVLLDAGAHYSTGTTDITRTIAVGDVTDEMRHNYTLVLKGHLALMDAIFPEHTTGLSLDVLARQYLWREGLDFRHGTGHGVGHILCVHEGPMSISKNKTAATTTELKRGMIISDEPGFYIEGKYGIRIESLLTVRRAEETEYGQFYRFMPLAAVPFDRDLIDVSLLSDVDISRLNDYHTFVRETILDELDDDVKEWVIEQTKEF